MQYRILTDDSQFDLAKEVELYLKEGWTLQGGVSVTFKKIGYYFAQAMVKE